MRPTVLLPAAAFALAALSSTPVHAVEASSEVESDPAALEAQTAEPAKLYGGIALAGLGGAASVTGVVLYAAFSADTAEGCGADGICVDPNRGAKTASIVTTVLGLGAIGVGIPLALSSDRQSMQGKPKREIRVGAGSVSLRIDF
jgi:hypothetical protein